MSESYALYPWGGAAHLVKTFDGVRFETWCGMDGARPYSMVTDTIARNKPICSHCLRRRLKPGEGEK